MTVKLNLCTHFVPMLFFLVYVTAVSLQAQNHSKERSIDLTITWHGPTQLSQGVFQGYQIFYRDTNRGQDFNVTLRTNDSFNEIQNLTPYTEYKITARSFTLEGEGRMSSSIFIWTAALGDSLFMNYVQFVLQAAMEYSH